MYAQRKVSLKQKKKLKKYINKRTFRKSMFPWCQFLFSGYLIPPSVNLDKMSIKSARIDKETFC